MTIFKKLPDDILNYLNDFINIKDKVNLYYSRSNNQELIKICYIKRIIKIFHNLTDKILQQDIFNGLIEINVRNNIKVTDLNTFYETLEIIDIGCGCGIDDNGIKNCLKLIEINAYSNNKIKDLNKFYQTLEIIDIGWDCGIDDNGIKDCLRLNNINAFGNPKIKDINKFNKTLKIINGGDFSYIF